MSKPVTITLSDGSVWQYFADGKNARGEVKPYWRCPALFRNDFTGRRDAPRLRPDTLAISILTAADHRAIADVLDPPTGDISHE